MALTEEEKKEQSRQWLGELRYAIKGDPGNPQDNGVVGKVVDIDKKLDDMNGRVRANSNAISWIRGILIGTGVLGGGTGIWAGITKLLGG